MWKRAVGLFCVSCFGFSLLCLRLGYIISNPYYVEVGGNQSSKTLTHQIKRGTIYDTHFQPMVNRQESYMAAIVLTPENVQQVERITDISKEDIERKLQNGKPYLEKVQVVDSDDENIAVFPVYTRYGQQQLAPHIIGYLSDGKGVTGIEKSYDALLDDATQSVRITYEMDAMGRPLPAEKPTVNTTGAGGGVVLTLDSEIQRICETVGAQIQKGAIVVMEADTGKLRAVCSFPSFRLETLAQDIQSEDSPMLNRAFTPLSVGSSFKIAIAASGLEQNISPLQKYTCTGSYTLGKTVMKCHHGEVHGEQTMEEALSNSCNPWFINLGLQLDKTKLVGMMRSLSFGKQFELAPGLYTQGGSVPDDNMSMGELANLSFGQGELLATPVQVAQMVSAIANQGTTPTPSLVEGTISDDGEWIEQFETPMGIKSVSKKNAELLRKYLITSNEQDGQNAKPTYTTAGGKTSTAQTGRFKDGQEVYFGWYAGFAPADEPKYTVVVIAEDAESGNKSAAPVFAEIVDQLYLTGKFQDE